MYSTLGQTCHDGKKRDMIRETLIWEVCYTRHNRDTIYLKRVTVGRISEPIYVEACVGTNCV